MAAIALGALSRGASIAFFVGRYRLTGWDVARHAREIDAGFPVVYMTGANADDWASKGAQEHSPVKAVRAGATAHSRFSALVPSLMEISRSYRRRLFLFGGFVTLVLHSRRFDAKLDRITQAGRNEVGFRAFPQRFQRSRVDLLDPTAQDNGCAW